MRVQCNHCDKKYTLPKERVAGRILKIRCRQCSELFQVDGSSIVLSSAPSVAPPVPSLPPSAPSLAPRGSSLAPRGPSLAPRGPSLAPPGPSLAPPGPSLAPPVSSLAPPVPSLAPPVPSLAPPVSSAAPIESLPPELTPHIELSTATEPKASSVSTQSALSVEVSKSAQEWMESVMSDVDRPITQEIKIDEITGHRSLPPEKRSNGAIFGVITLLICGAVYVMTQVSTAPRSTPQVVSLNLEAHSEGKSIDKTTSKPIANDEIADQLKSDKVALLPIHKETEGSKQTIEPIVQTSKDAKATVSPVKPAKTKPKAKPKAKPKKRDKTRNKSSLEEFTRTLSTAKTEGSKELKFEGDLSGARANSKSRTNKPAATGKVVEAKLANRSSSRKKHSKKSSSARVKKAERNSTKTSRKSSKRGKGLDRSTISSVMNQNAGGLEHCYRKSLKKDSSFGAVKTRLKLIVGTGGRVARKTISLSGKYRNTRLESCIKNTVVRWYFPKAPGETPVRYPLNFSPGF
jgi:hypothetical protein